MKIAPDGAVTVYPGRYIEYEVARRAAAMVCGAVIILTYLRRSPTFILSPVDMFPPVAFSDE